MIAEFETGNGNPNRRLLKKFDRQIAWLSRQPHLLTHGHAMKRKAFDEQAEMLRRKIEALTEPPTGNTLILTCLPHGSLVKKMRRVRCGKHVGTCDCQLELLETEHPPKTLYALLGIDDGRERRIQVNGEGVGKFEVREMVLPDHPFQAWAGIDMAFHFPNILQQQGLILGGTAIRGTLTAIWLHHGRPIFGSTLGRSFKECHGGRWAVPSYQKLITP